MVLAYSLGFDDGWSNRCIKHGEDNSYMQQRMHFRRKADSLGKFCLSPWCGPLHSEQSLCSASTKHAKMGHSGRNGRGLNPLPLEGTYELQVILLFSSFISLE